MADAILAFLMLFFSAQPQAIVNFDSLTNDSCGEIVQMPIGGLYFHSSNAVSQDGFQYWNDPNDTSIGIAADVKGKLGSGNVNYITIKPVSGWKMNFKVIAINDSRRIGASRYLIKSYIDGHEMSAKDIYAWQRKKIALGFEGIDSLRIYSAGTGKDVAATIEGVEYELVDKIPPSILGMPHDTEIQTDLNHPFVNYTWDEPHAVDSGSGIMRMSSNYMNGGGLGFGKTYIVYSAEDFAGNVGKDSFVVDVKCAPAIAPDSSDGFSVTMGGASVSSRTNDKQYYFGTQNNGCEQEQECQTIDVKTHGKGSLFVRIYDECGALIAETSSNIENGILSGDAYETKLEWNLCSKSNSSAPSGVYIWKIVWRDVNGIGITKYIRTGIK